MNPTKYAIFVAGKLPQLTYRSVYQIKSGSHHDFTAQTYIHFSSYPHDVMGLQCVRGLPLFCEQKVVGLPVPYAHIFTDILTAILQVNLG